MLILPAATRLALLAALAEAHITCIDSRAREAQAAQLFTRPARPIEIVIPAVIAPVVVSSKPSVHLKNGARSNHAPVVGIP